MSKIYDFQKFKTIRSFGRESYRGFITLNHGLLYNMVRYVAFKGKN